MTNKGIALTELTASARTEESYSKSVYARGRAQARGRGAPELSLLRQKEQQRKTPS